MDIEDYFNTAQIKIMASVDECGVANLCPCGTAMMHEGIIIIGCVGVAKSRENVINSKKATFMVSNPVSNENWKKYEEVGELPSPAGYRLYCTFIEETQKDEVMKPIRENLIVRVGERISSKLASAMTFDVDDVREIRF